MTCEDTVKSPTKGEEITFSAIDAHGGERYENAYFLFTFRDKKYTFENAGKAYEYTRSYEKNDQTIFEVLNNEGFSRSIDGKEVTLNEKQIAGGSESLNSVIYFATLPHKLLDKAVNKKYIGETTIKDEPYHIIEVTFNQEGGGSDYEDNYHYWINKNTNIVDYFAYDYQVNNGGVRFRSAYNGRVVGGILFQDYINYKAEVGTALIDLPKLWEEGKLKELSRIETEDVKELRN